jgi:hypothetical protein
LAYFTGSFPNFRFLFFRFRRTLAASLTTGFTMSQLERAIAYGHAKLSGKPEEYRFYKGDTNNDIQPVSKETPSLDQEMPPDPEELIL